MACTIKLLNGDALTVTDESMTRLAQLTPGTSFVELVKSDGQVVFVAAAAVAYFEEKVHKPAAFGSV